MTPRPRLLAPAVLAALLLAAALPAAAGPRYVGARGEIHVAFRARPSRRCWTARSIPGNGRRPRCWIAMDNIKDNRAIFFAGDGLKKIKNQKFDLLICNPPYVPRPKSIDDNPYEGVGVLKYLLDNAKHLLNPGGVLLINISSLFWDMPMSKKPELPYKVIGKMTVPLKVNNIMNNKAWLNYLVKKRGLQKKHRQGYEYWQDIIIVALYK